MNLYIINESCRASAYGIGTYINELTTALKDSDINVCMIYLRSDNRQKETKNVIHICSPINHDRSINLNEQDELYYRDVVSQLQNQIKNAKRLIFHLNYLKNNTLAKILRKTFDCRIIATAHCFNWGFYIFDNLPRLRNIMDENHPDNFTENLRKSVEEEKSLFTFVDHIVCSSNYMRDILCLDYGLVSTKITVIPNGLGNKYNSTVDTQQLREKWKIPANEKIILFAGRMDAVKGLEYLLKAFRKVLSFYPPSRLVIVGEGAFGNYTKLSQDICTRITYTGFLNKLQLYEWYQIAEIGVIPSLFEPFGYVAAEMMMHGLPVVATATSGLNEVVDETCGLKIPLITHPDRVEIDINLLVEAIIYLLQNPLIAKEMGQNGRKRYLKHYTSEMFRKNMLKLYHSLFTYDTQNHSPNMVGR